MIHMQSWATARTHFHISYGRGRYIILIRDQHRKSTARHAVPYKARAQPSRT